MRRASSINLLPYFVLKIMEFLGGMVFPTWGKLRVIHPNP
tara:strand:- start:1832 stop:1951 length:120 start_codon:yes stop_codon:yes gene_type:complete